MLHRLASRLLLPLAQTTTTLLLVLPTTTLAEILRLNGSGLLSVSYSVLILVLDFCLDCRKPLDFVFSVAVVALML